MEKSPPSNPPRVILSDEEKLSISKSVLLEKWEQQEEYINHLISRTGDDEKLKLQQQEATRRENVLLMRLATKEQEMQEFLSQIQELKEKQAPSTAQLQSMLIDPAVNLLFEKMKTELTETKDRLEQAQNDLSAWKFTPDSTTGKKLMAKCRMLHQENQELGKQLSQGRIAQLEAELALQKKYSDELKGSQDEMNEFVIQLDEEVEGMQATICALQDELKTTKTKCHELEEDNQTLRSGSMNLSQTVDALPNGGLKQEESELIQPKMEMVDDDNRMGVSNNQSLEDEEEHLIPLTRKEFEDERTLLSNGDSNMTDASEELPMETETRITSLSLHTPPSPNTNSLTDELLLKSEQQQPLVRPNHVTVIRGTEENNYISPTKCVTKTSFSINDLLAGPGTDDIKRETILPENGMVPVTVLNGNIDGHVI